MMKNIMNSFDIVNQILDISNKIQESSRIGLSNYLLVNVEAAKILGKLFKENEGITIKPEGDMVLLLPENTNSLLVYRKNGQIKVNTSELVEDDGTLIFMED